MEAQIELLTGYSLLLGALITIAVQLLKTTPLYKYFQGNADLLVVIASFLIAILWEASYGSFGGYVNALWVAFLSAGSSIFGYTVVVNRKSKDGDKDKTETVLVDKDGNTEDGIKVENKRP